MLCSNKKDFLVPQKNSTLVLGLQVSVHSLSSYSFLQKVTITFLSIFSFLLSVYHYNCLFWGVYIAFLRHWTFYQATPHVFLHKLIYSYFRIPLNVSSKHCLAYIFSHPSVPPYFPLFPDLSRRCLVV